MTLTLKPLTTNERKKFEELETEIKNGLINIANNQFAIGSALIEIRDSRLYRQSFPTFEDYCRKRLGMSKTHANRHIGFIKVARTLTDTIQPQKESQIRALNKLPEDRRSDAWSTAVSASKGAVPTAKIVSSVVDDMLSSKTATKIPPAPTTRYVNHTLMVRDLKRNIESNGWKIDAAALKFIENYKS